MDVTKPQRIKAIRDPLDRKLSDTGHKSADTNDQSVHEHFPAWSTDEAISLAGALAGSLSLETQKILRMLAAEMKPLRAELDRMTARESYYRELAVKHTFLPIPNRREFLRELSHVINDIGRLQVRPGLLLFHISNAADFRRQYGRSAQDFLLTHVAGTIIAAAQITDIVGSIGGDDFGVILLTGGVDKLCTRTNEILEQLYNAPFKWLGHEYQLSVSAGWTELRENWSAEDAFKAADKSLCENFLQ